MTRPFIGHHERCTCCVCDSANYSGKDFLFHYEECKCAKCRREQDNANAPASESKNDAPREMTAGDLGLDVEGAFWLQFSRKHGLPAIARWRPFDAPYSFWLGKAA